MWGQQSLLHPWVPCHAPRHSRCIPQRVRVPVFKERCRMSPGPEAPCLCLSCELHYGVRLHADCLGHLVARHSEGERRQCFVRAVGTFFSRAWRRKVFLLWCHAFCLCGRHSRVGSILLPQSVLQRVCAGRCFNVHCLFFRQQSSTSAETRPGYARPSPPGRRIASSTSRDTPMPFRRLLRTHPRGKYCRCVTRNPGCFVCFSLHVASVEAGAAVTV